MPDDARLLELEWLTTLERDGRLDVPATGDNSPERRLLAHLYMQEFAVDPSAPPLWRFEPLGVMRHMQETKWAAIRNAMTGHSQSLAITHAGAVRRAELADQLKANRIKDSMGLVWDGRHFQRDTRIALLDAAPGSPLAVVYLDLNDVKVFNAISHAAGDDAIRRYLELVAELTFERGDAYRLSGGADEVVILLPKHDLNTGVVFARSLLDALGRETVHGHTLRAAAGVVVATEPTTAVDALKKRADAEQLRAKEASRAADGRPSVLAWAERLEVLAG